MKKALYLSKLNQIAVIRFNNFSTRTIISELREALDECRTCDDIKAVVITGAGKVFCPYHILNYDMKIDIVRPVIDIRKLNKPVIAAINGSVCGLGYSIAMACDIRIAANTAKFISIDLDTVSTLFLSLLIGFSSAMELISISSIIDAGRAFEIRLVNKVVGEPELESVSIDIAQKLAFIQDRAFLSLKEMFSDATYAWLKSSYRGQNHNQTECLDQVFSAAKIKKKKSLSKKSYIKRTPDRNPAVDSDNLPEF